MEALVSDERVRTCVFDALLLDVLGDANTNVLDATLPNNNDDDDHAFVDFQADLDALDALIEQHTASPLRLHSSGDVNAVSATTGASMQAGDTRTDAVSTTTRASGNRNSSSSGSASETSSEPSSAPKRKSAPGGNNARKRQREELRSLRESAAQLEDALQALKTKTSAPSSGSSDATRRRSVPRDRTPSMTVDDHARQITELENIHLSKLVNDHVKVAQSFERALRKHRPLSATEILAEAPPALVLAAAPRLKETPLPSSVPTSADLNAFETLEKDVDARYPDVERVFQDVGLAECRTNVREATIETHRSDGVLLSFKTSRLIPFSVSLINETAIRIAQANYTNGPGHIIRRMGGTVSFKKQFQVGDVVINVRGVSKRYVEANRIVLIWSGVSEWASDGDVITINEKGWGIIQPFPSSSNSASRKSKTSTSPLSLFQSYIAMTPGVNGGSGVPQPKHIAVLSDVVLPSYQEIFDGRFQQLENTLVHDSLLRRRLVA